VAAPLADVDDVRLSTRWAFLTLIPATLASGDGPPPWQPPPIHSAADLPAAMAAALGDVCRFEPMFTGGLGGCKCKPDPDPTHLIPRPQCDPPPEPGSPAFERLMKVAPFVEIFGKGGGTESVRSRFVWEIVWGRPSKAWSVGRLVGRGRPKSPSTDLAVFPDSAAAWLVRAQDTGDARDLLAALDLAAQESRLPQSGLLSSWNRALALEYMHLEHGARKAWLAAAQLGIGSASDLARERAESLAARELSRAWEVVGSTGGKSKEPVAAPSNGTSSESTSRVRRRALEELLPAWARSVREGAKVAAENIIVKLTGAGILLWDQSRDSHVSALANDLGSLQGAHQMQVVAQGVEAFERGIQCYRRRDIMSAISSFRVATRLTRVLLPPLASVARIELAAAMYQGGDARRALQIAQEVELLADRKGFRALRARAEWVLGTLAADAGRGWAAPFYLLDAQRAYEGIGEEGTAAILSVANAALLLQWGEERDGWVQVLSGLRGYLRNPSSERRFSILDTAAVLASRQGWRSAADLLLEEASRESAALEPVSLTYLELDRVRNVLDGQSPAAAKSYLAAAQSASEGISDAPTRRAVEMELAVARAEVAANADPSKALSELGRAESAARALASEANVKQIHLLRARTLRRLHQFSEADFELDGEIRRELGRVHGPNSRLPVEPRALSFLDQALRERAALVACDLNDPSRALSYVALRRSVGVMSQSSAAFPGLSQRRTDSVDLLESDEDFVVFEVHDHETLRWSKLGGQTSFSVLQLSRDELRGMAEEIRSALVGISSSAQSADWRVVGAALLPSAAWQCRTRPLWLALDGPLEAIPFSALSADSGGLVLGSVRPVVVVSGIGLDQEAKVGAAGARQVAGIVVANPTRPWMLMGQLPELVGAETEAFRLHQRFPQLSILERKAATRTAFEEQSLQASIIVIAAHAVGTTSDESGPALVLAAESGASGLLYASEIRRLQLRGRPIVLVSGCSTALRSETRQQFEGSLASAFLSAGARVVVGTLWSVDDSVVADFSSALLAEWEAGAPVPQAFQSAQMALRSEEAQAGRHTGNWAAFVATMGKNDVD
jgi:CHAT domain-containing protein